MGSQTNESDPFNDEIPLLNSAAILPKDNRIPNKGNVDKKSKQFHKYIRDSGIIDSIDRLTLPLTSWTSSSGAGGRYNSLKPLARRRGHRTSVGRRDGDGYAVNFNSTRYLLVVSFVFLIAPLSIGVGLVIKMVWYGNKSDEYSVKSLRGVSIRTETVVTGKKKESVIILENGKEQERMEHEEKDVTTQFVGPNSTIINGSKNSTSSAIAITNNLSQGSHDKYIHSISSDNSATKNDGTSSNGSNNDSKRLGGSSTIANENLDNERKSEIEIHNLDDDHEERSSSSSRDGIKEEEEEEEEEEKQRIR